LPTQQRPTSNLEWEKMKKQTYDLEERLLEYSVRIIKIVEQLPNTKAGNQVAGQLLKSGTSPYPNHGEAQAAESPKDFIHKLRISLKELRESQRWLKLIQRVPLINKPELLNDILQETEESIKIFVTSIKTAEKKPRLGVVECSVLDGFFHSTLDVGCSMFDVHLSKQPLTA
jgi:four helix bundle protein